ncbi:hypothetical protein BC830DRAFT_1174681 [Chytriomyces sp. MP71]|nr:hypothetical protein BC830DRAFT_1174681 [Chytriomyces sp. MP71]
MRSVALFVQFCLVLSSTHAVILRHSVSNHRKGAYHKASKRVAKHVLRAASQAPNMTFSWAPELWKNAPAVPIWSSYFKNAVPNPEVPASDVYTCTVDPTMWGVTIDDGPSPLEPQTRAYFAQKNISTSFFHIGTMVAENPQVLLDTFNAGHMIG